MKRKGGAKRKAREIGSGKKRKPSLPEKGSRGFFFCLPLFLQKRVCLGFPLMGKLFYKSAFLGLPGREAVSRRLTEKGSYQKTDRFLPSIGKVKKLKEKPRERTAVFFFTDLLGALRKPIHDTTKFFFSLPFLFPKRKGRSIKNKKTKSDP